MPEDIAMRVDRNALLAAAAAAAFVGLLAAESALVSADTPLAAPAEASAAPLRIALGAERGARVSDANGGPECCNALSISPARARASCSRARCCS